MSEKILVTGCAGFIGMHLSLMLLKKGFKVFGIDNVNDFYDPKLKKDRLKKIISNENFYFKKVDIENYKSLESVFMSFKPSKVVNLAAQAGVRYSLDDPQKYISTNVTGFINILECCRHYNTAGLIYASSSSVYGKNKKFPFSVHDNTDKPISIYAASKKANELMAYSYSHLYNLNTTGLRFFTVYGPWGRPDMVLYKFANKIIENKPIQVYNNGEMFRDFTYIDDIVNGIISSINKNYKCRIFNLGNGQTFQLMELIDLLSNRLGKNPTIQFLGMQLGDVQKTIADINSAKKDLEFNPKVSLDLGVSQFCEWYLKYINL